MSNDNSPRVSRRALIHGTGTAVLSAAAVSLLAGVKIANATSSTEDVNILNVALGLEHEAINCYQIGAQSGLLKKPVLEVATRIQSHHKTHRDSLISTIEKLGGKPVVASTLDDYAKALKTNTLKSQTDVLKLAAKLELGAANAYLGVIPSFKDSALAKVAGRLAADEASHWTILNNALGNPLPEEACSFGA